MLMKLIGFGLLLCVHSSALAASLTGEVTNVNDGDTFKIWGQSIRLLGIDAPENAQTCKNKKGVKYQCGDSATNHLKKIIKKSEVRCEGSDKDAYKRLLATCFIGDTNINKKMVEDGWAVAFLKYSTAYEKSENLAKSMKLGMWAGDFIRPAEFRSGVWKEAEAKIAVDTANSDCKIKGNINSKDEKIYHTPWGSKSYKRTKINTSKGERWFCDEAQALAAGWRAPYR
jgi:endonuclease YncB( thermonuclease family)